MSEVKAALRLLKVKEAAERLGLSEWRFYELLRLGLGPPHLRLGRSIRISEAALVQWIEQQSQQREEG